MAEASKSTSRAKIHFSPGASRKSFAAAGINNAGNADATTVVRELIQNSVDAFKEKPSKDKSPSGRAVIRFEVDNVNVSDLPGIVEMKEAFPLAVDAQTEINEGTFPAVQKQLVTGIKRELDKESCNVLSVSDNGVGLNKARMRAILFEGVSKKESTGAGAHGYGHQTVIPSSGVRLVYYGGVFDSGERIASGHCILAPFQAGEKFFQEDGYLVESLKESMVDPFNFLYGTNIPPVISKKLDQISKRDSTGAVVMVPYFNNFKCKDDLWKMIKKAAALNFFASFARDEIRVEFVSDGREERLSQDNVAAVLEEFSTETKAESFISGEKAFECFKAIDSVEDMHFETGVGTVSGKLIKDNRAKGRRIDLCRNGMWIIHNYSGAKKLPKLQVSSFDSYQRFHLVLLLEASSGEFYELFRQAEPPMHDRLDMGLLLEEDQKTLDGALRQLQVEIKKQLEKVENTPVKMGGFLEVPIGGNASGGEPGRRAGEWESFSRGRSSVKGKDDIHDGPGGTTGTRKKRTKKKKRNGGGVAVKKKGNPSPFRAMAAPEGPRSYEVEILPSEDLEIGDLQFKIDQNMDETCKHMNSEPHVYLRNVRVDGRPADKSAMLGDSPDKVYGIRLRKLEIDKAINIRFDFDVSQNLKLPDDKNLGLKVEVIRRQSEDK